MEIDGRVIDDFEKLVNVIYEKEPGDIVPIVFYRGNDKLQVEAELLPWPKEKSSAFVPTNEPAKPLKKPLQ